MSRILVLVLIVPLLAACQGDSNAPPATGAVSPTVAGAAGPTGFQGYQDARLAFTRRSEDGVLQATLEDAAWLKFEGSADEVQAKHRAYFEYGYTSFQVLLRAKEFTRPTNETFVLEDSAGARVSSKPVSFQGNLTLVDDRWQYAFDLSFRHTITGDLRWLKLTRVEGGAAVEWQLGGAAAR